MYKLCFSIFYEYVCANKLSIYYIEYIIYIYIIHIIHNIIYIYIYLHIYIYNIYIYTTVPRCSLYATAEAQTLGFAHPKRSAKTPHKTDGFEGKIYVGTMVLHGVSH